MSQEKKIHSQDDSLAIMIIAGGSGTRFWPLSTARRPKQFLKLFGEESMLRMTYRRLADLAPPERILVFTAARHTALVHQEIPELPKENIVGEPMIRDTAAPVALGAAILKRRFGNPVIAVLPADQLVYPVDDFQRQLLAAAALAHQDPALFTFGIEPTFPATGYGYLECGAPLGKISGSDYFELRSFKEKPQLETARSYMEAGRYFWNSGMFVWQAEAILEEVSRLLPEHAANLFPLLDKPTAALKPAALTKAFADLPKISIDYGVMEKAKRLRMIKAAFLWSDVGGWLALEEFLDADESGNRGRGRLLARNAAGNLVFCESSDETVALVGVEGLVVVRSGNKTLIVHRDATEEIKKLVEAMPPEEPEAKKSKPRKKTAARKKR